MSLKNIELAEVSDIYLTDDATGGTCFNCYIKVQEYEKLMRDTYKDSNEFQRRIINIKKSSIYQKLIKDLIRGVVIPTISLYLDGQNTIEKNMHIDNENVQILDGLQRTNCIMYALDLLRGTIEDELKILDNKDNLSYIEFSNKLIRLEIWTNLTVNGILYKMVSLNAGQTPMEIEHQLEVLELPLKKELQSKYNIEIYTKQESRNRRSNLGFNISSLVEGIIAYNTESIFPKKQNTAISIMDSMEIKSSYRESTFLKSEYLMEDLVWVIDKLHKQQIITYEGDEKLKGILSESDVFFIPFMAALGHARKELDEITFDTKKSRLLEMLKCSNFDPWNLSMYTEISDSIKSNIGQKKRQLVYTTFIMFFTTSDSLSWQISKNFI